jgi:hypothetical protein
VPDRRFTPFLTTFLICAAALSVSTPAASASRESREASRATREAQRDATRTAREQERDARQTERSKLRREREELRAARAAERTGHETTQTEVSAGEGADEHPAPVLPPASASGRATCAISAESSADSVTAGEPVTISGKLTCPTLEEASGQNVTVYQHEFGAASAVPTVVGTVTTADDGSYQFHSAALKARSRFRLRAANTRFSPRVTIQVDAAISLQGPAASGAALTMWNAHLARAANIADFSGTVQPQAADTAVALKVRYGSGAWHWVAATNTDAQGSFSFRHRFRYAGAVSVMVVSRPRGDRRTSSAELSYTIVQAQNPALTIGQPATAPVALVPTPGQAVITSQPTTITGIASAGPGRTVTLRALGSGRFKPVATTVADASGAYSFTVAPTETTVYEVTCGRQHSTPLRVEVG